MTSSTRERDAWAAKDQGHCVALHHEFLRCEDAFYEFRGLKKQIPIVGFSRHFSYRIYNVYARYILHLYEFMIGALTREIELKIITNKAINLKKTFYGDDVAPEERCKTIEALIGDMTRRAVRNVFKQQEINVPGDFAEKFRKCRNKIIGHVTFDRAQIDMTDFYSKYDIYLTAIFLHSQSHWGIGRQKDFPDLNQITTFFANLEQEVGRK